MVNPDALQVVLVVVQPAVAGVEVTAYPVMGSPPVFVGAFHDTWAKPLPGIAWTEIGAPGTVGVGSGLG